MARVITKSLTPFDGMTHRLLLVESDANDANLISRQLLRKGFRIERVSRLADARKRISSERFDIVLASDALPDGSALDLVEMEGASPVVLLSDELREDDVRTALAAGTLDVFVKDAHLLPLLEVRLGRLLSHQADRKRLSELLEENGRLAAANRILAEVSMKDPLTGIFNRRGFDEAVRREVSRVVRTSDALAVAYFDLDHFKAINDDHGHDAGDAVLRTFAELLRNEARGLDVIARVGGDEFATLLPSANLSGALRYAERVRAGFETATVPFRGSALSTTVSGGAALYAGSSQEEFLKAADEHLYRAKAAGRNRVVALVTPPIQ